MRSGAAAGWTISCESPRSTCGSNTTPSSARARCALPIDHPDPAHLIVSGTGITHLGSATARDAMHPGRTAGAERGGDSDSMRMFRMGVEGGKPAAGKAGVQPEWFYKGDGSIIVPPGTPLTMPAFAVTGGEEAEIVGVYVVDDHGTPRRIGFVLGNEFSDHGLEEQNYLYAAHSKLRECSMGPELLLGDLPDSVRGLSRVLRARRDAVERRLPERRGPHVALDREPRAPSFQARDVPPPRIRPLPLLWRGGAELCRRRASEPGDVFKLDVPVFGRPLRNTLRVAEPETVAVEPL